MNKNKILVHLHIFYHDQVDFFIEKLKNINGYDWDLIVTYCDENESTNHKLIDFKPNCRLQKVENVGYDVLPFIKVIKSIDIDKYDYILKLHTKNYQQKLYLNGFKKGGYWWRNELINPLIGSKRSFAKCINKFRKNNKIGFICSRIMLWEVGNYWPEDTYMLKAELKRINFKSNYNKFCAGTMFIARAEIFKFLQNIDINENKFPIAGKTKTTGTLAHVYERIFTIATNEFGYEVFTVKNYKEYFKQYFKSFTQKIFELKQGELYGVKTKKLTILGFNIHFFKKAKEITFPTQCIDIEYIDKNLDSINKLAIFASFNRNGIIDDRVVYYIKNLSPHVDGIIFVTDNPILPNEFEKIKPYISAAICKRHGEYDFGSYKRGFLFSKKHNILNSTEQLIICNDSCYGPINGFKEVFDDFNSKKTNFYGLSLNYEIKEHIQSFFYIFDKKVIDSKCFITFIKNIKKEKCTYHVIKNYETKLTKYLNDFGFSHSIYIPNELPEINTQNNKTFYPLTLIKDYRYPLIKVKTFNNGLPLQESPFEALEYIKNINSELYEIIIKENPNFLS